MWCIHLSQHQHLGQPTRLPRRPTIRSNLKRQSINDLHLHHLLQKRNHHLHHRRSPRHQNQNQLLFVTMCQRNQHPNQLSHQKGQQLRQPTSQDSLPSLTTMFLRGQYIRHPKSSHHHHRLSLSPSLISTTMPHPSQ